MKENIKEILEEITSYGKKEIVKIRLVKPEEELGFELTLMVVEELLYWQKMVIAEEFIDDDVQVDKYIIDDLLHSQCLQFFEHFDDIEEIFELHDDHIAFNAGLSTEEIVEIQDFINGNHRIEGRIRRS